MVNATPRPLYAQGRDLVHIVQEAGWAPRPSVWTGAENLTLTGIRCSDHAACSESLYRLSYPGPTEDIQEERTRERHSWRKKLHEYKETYPLRRNGMLHASSQGHCVVDSLLQTLLTYSMVQSPFEKLTGLQLVKKLPAFYGTRRFITALTSVRHLSLSWASPIQSIYPHPTSWRSIVILFTHLRLGLPSGLLPSGFPTKTLYVPLFSPTRTTCPAHLILLQTLT